MGEKLVVGPINSGLQKNRTPFMIDNDSFPVLVNAYQWRGRVKRKRGTRQLGRLQVQAIGAATNPVTPITLSIQTSGTAYSIVDLLNDPNVLYSPGMTIRTQFPNAQIVPATLSVQIVTYHTLTDVSGVGTLTDLPNTDTGTINYTTGALSLTLSSNPGVQNVNVLFSFYPNIPVMGIEDFATTNNDFPGTISFDPNYSYQINSNFPYRINNSNYYNNPPSSGDYVAKTTWTSFNWNGQDYQQFWTTNYQGSLWATNGITTPFSTTHIGLQFKKITDVTVVAPGPPAKATLTIANHGLVEGDFVFVNEINTTTGINYQTGFVIAVVDANNVTVEFPASTIANNSAGQNGVAQYLTNTAIPGLDCIKYYTGSAAFYNGTMVTFTNGLGWVNFMPPLCNSPFSIGDLPRDIYYLAGARMIFPFKDRLIFVGAVVQSKSTGPFYLQDTVVYSQNGTPYYTASFTGDVLSSATVFTASDLVPVNQSATPTAFLEDVTGFGGFVTSGLDQPIITVAPNEDVLLMGFNPTFQSRFVYSGNDILPFNFYVVNSELGSASTFSAITMDEAVISRGPRGYTSANQVRVNRIDVPIPDEVFEISLNDNGNERFTSYRDFVNEWIYFTYPGNTINYKYPNTTLLYNYRDNSWAKFFESYTTYGTFRPVDGLTWATIDWTWNQWDSPWNSSVTTPRQPIVLGGNQQGFIMERVNITEEDPSLYIQSFSGNTVTSPNHCLNTGDFILITGALGTIGTEVNGKVFSVENTTQNTFDLNPSISAAGLTYLGSGVITRYYVPFIQTKQFPMAWSMGRKTRIGPQQHLLSTTQRSQITLNMYLSQDDATVWNTGPIVPTVNPSNSSLIYSQILYTCPESTNLGLTPLNTNLQELNLVPSTGTASTTQAQMWHRMNTSLIGDTVQLAYTMSDAQMRDTRLENQTAEIELHGFILDLNPSQMLS